MLVKGLFVPTVQIPICQRRADNAQLRLIPTSLQREETLSVFQAFQPTAKDTALPVSQVGVQGWRVLGILQADPLPP